jgi:hypothetical protein
MCRKAVRSVAGAKMIISEHVRFDVTQGILISDKLLKLKRVVKPAKLMPPPVSDDIGVCQIRTQLLRQQSRENLLQQVEKHTHTDLSNVIKTSIDTNFDHTTVVVGESITCDIVDDASVASAPPLRRKRGRPKATLSSDGSVIQRFATIESAILLVQGIHDRYNCKQIFPTRKHFTQANELYLYTLIEKGKKFGVSFKIFAEKCGYSVAKVPKRRRVHSPPP